MRAGTPQGAEAGFTLIELLVSLVLLTMTALLLLATMTAGGAADRRAVATAQDGETIVAAQGLLRGRIETMVAEARLGPGQPIVDVDGEAERLTFTAPPAAALRPLPPQRFRLLLTPAGGLVLFTIDPLTLVTDPDAPAVLGWTPQPLLAGVTRLEIAYFGVAPPDGQRRWRSRWHDRPGLPELVRIRLAFAAGDRRLWPDLIIRPTTTINTACLLDRATGRCRGAA